MNKKNYTSPQVRVYILAPRTIIATSGPQVDEGSTNEQYSKEQYPSSIWD